MKISKGITKKRKISKKDGSEISKKGTKIQLRSKSIENKKKGKGDGLTESNKKIKLVKRLRNAQASSWNENKKNAMKKGKKEKKKVGGIADKKAKEVVQVPNPTPEGKEKDIIIKSNTKKASLKRKSLTDTKESKKLKADSKDITKDLLRKHILQCISAIFHLTQEQLNNKSLLFSEESQPIFLQVTCIRVPKVPRRQVRILLPHSTLSPEDDIALFVCDLERGRRKDYEPTIQHYRELLDKYECTKVKDIIPMNQVKTEYDQYELKRKLVDCYDHFLVDGRITGHVFHLLGKVFYDKRKLPTSIRMDSKDLKREIDYALRKTTMRLHSFGDTHIVQVANTSMKKKHILENILAACNKLAEVYPGGWSNIRSIRIKTKTSPSLPIYVTLKNKNTVETPVIQPKRPKAYCNVEGELTTLSGDATVIVTPGGKVIVNRTFPEESEGSEEEENVENV